MDWMKGLFGGDNDTQTVTQNDYRPAPEYAEAEGARGKWWETLQSWNPSNGYGAIAPNWGDIWSNARGKLSRQYWGGPEGPGAVAKVKASAARRGVSDSPALQTTIGRMGMQEGNQLMDMAIQQAIAEANLGESGRKTWLSSVQNLASQKPQMLNYGSMSTKMKIPNPVGDVVGGAGELAMAGEGGGGGFDIMSLFGGGGGGTGISTGDPYGGGASGLGSAGGNGLFGYFDSNEDFGKNSGDVFSDPQTYAQIAQIAMMFCWVAAEIYGGWEEPETVACRHYIGNIGPKWFKNLYLKHGEKFAEFIKDKPVVKAVIKPLFNYFAWRGGYKPMIQEVACVV